MISCKLYISLEPFQHILSISYYIKWTRGNVLLIRFSTFKNGNNAYLLGRQTCKGYNTKLINMADYTKTIMSRAPFRYITSRYRERPNGGGILFGLSSRNWSTKKTRLNHTVMTSWLGGLKKRAWPLPVERLQNTERRWGFPRRDSAKTGRLSKRSVNLHSASCLQLRIGYQAVSYTHLTLPTKA